jgi:hypothetical protein
MRFLTTAVARLFPAVAALSVSGFTTRAPVACELTAHEKAWLRESLFAWEEISTRVLHLPAAPHAPVILFDAACEYRLDAGAMTPTGTLHGGHIALPNTQRLAPAPVGFASLAVGDTAPFLVMALRSVWESDTMQIDEDWDQFLTRSFIHEMTHTRQLPVVVPRLRAAGGLAGMNDVDDDIIQETFDTSAAFGTAVQREIQLLYEAAAARGAADRQRRARLALNAIKARREQFFGGEAAPWAFVEQVMLDLEGAAEFAELSYLRLANPRTPPTRLLQRVRGDHAFWSQDEGLALFLLLDALHPGWSGETFTGDPRSALDLIDMALTPPNGQ